MNNTAYYQSIAQAYKQVCEGSERTNKVPNASYQLSKIYDEQYGVSGKGREHDEPTEPRKTQYQRVVDKKAYDADIKVWKQRNQQAVSKERLKRKGAVPIKGGKRLFEDFMEEVDSRTGKKTKENERDHKRLKQVYLAARALEYDKWVMFITEMM